MKKDGEVLAWGQNVAGQLGTGSTGVPQAQPLKVNGLPAIKAIAAGIAHSLALDVSGNVWAWGQNANGQAGLGTAGGTVLMPAQLTALSGIQAIAANGNYSLALGVDGRVWAWGQNTAGQVGTGATSASVATPTAVAALPTIRAVAAGLNHVLALDADEKVWSWGQNTSGQVGTGSTGATVLVPRRIVGIPNAKGIAAGAGHSLIIDEQFGNVWAWGQNTFGQVGTGAASSTSVLTPGPVSGVFAATAIVAGHNHSLAIMGNGLVKAWGHNAFGQLGDGTTVSSASALGVTGFGDAKAIAAGAQHSLALRPGCPVWGWGNNGQGQLGTGTASSTPTTVAGSTLIIDTFYFDTDMDGYGNEYVSEQACEPSPGFVEELDCDDYTSTTYPGAPELCNGVDDSCDGLVDDGNPEGGGGCSTGLLGVCATGVTACTNGSVVCQQTQVASAEQCDLLDNDCDGEADEGNPGGLDTCDTKQLGICGAGVTFCSHGVIACVQKERPAAEVCDSVDNNCDGSVDEGMPTQAWYRDADGDGAGNASQSVQDCRQPSGYVATAGDCDDGNSAIRPGVTEVCDSVDNNCDGTVDENVGSTWYRDADGDGHGRPDQSVVACTQPTGYVANTTDCNDSSAAIRPGATEACDSVDNNCDGAVDENVGSTWYRDADSDGHGRSDQSVVACSQPAGYVANTTDCNDGSAGIRPGATEVCDSVDNNCNGTVDEDVKLTWYRDADGDGHGRTDQSTLACTQPAGYVANTTDCNDSSAAIRPGATEVCDAVDNNCNGTVDENVGSTWYRDADGDGHGRSDQSVVACTQPTGYVANTTDCNDSSAAIRPGVTEVCDSVDNNCNGSVDENVGSTWYRDADGDGHGRSDQTTRACTQPAGYVANTTDCNDGSAAIQPGASEVCDSVDNNCNGSVDENVTPTWYRDADGDGHGRSDQSTLACAQPAGYVANTTDCNDSNSAIRPGASEVCDSVDNNCNGTVDENVTPTWYRDVDGDNYGVVSNTVSACTRPAGYAAASGDCNDNSATVNPGASEACDTIDNNCDGEMLEYPACKCPPVYDLTFEPGWATTESAVSTLPPIESIDCKPRPFPL
ncbi:sialidase [Myxococcus sp. QH3KD-4-1]|nr:sialidase [Myxococcus qinghaiensis]